MRITPLPSLIVFCVISLLPQKNFYYVDKQLHVQQKIIGLYFILFIYFWILRREEKLDENYMILFEWLLKEKVCKHSHVKNVYYATYGSGMQKDICTIHFGNRLHIGKNKRMCM